MSIIQGKPIPVPKVEKKVKIGPVFKGESYDRQKRGQKYWFEDQKEIKPGKPMGTTGNTLGLTNAL